MARTHAAAYRLQLSGKVPNLLTLSLVPARCRAVVAWSMAFLLRQCSRSILLCTIGRGYVVCPFLRSCPLLGVFFMGDSTVNTSCLVYSTDRTV